MKKSSLISILIIFIASGCAAPGPLKEKAASFLRGACYDKFVESGWYSYQHLANMPINPKVAYALSADSNGAQSCGAAWRREVTDDFWTEDASWEKIEALALSRCEDFRLKNNASSSPCKIYARNNEIVWDQYKNENFKMQ
jgi:hypothetical protein